jgi:hypothetical protein
MGRVRCYYGLLDLFVNIYECLVGSRDESGPDRGKLFVGFKASKAFGLWGDGCFDTRPGELRALPRLRQSLGQNVIVENGAGADATGQRSLCDWGLAACGARRPSPLSYHLSSPGVPGGPHFPNMGQIQIPVSASGFREARTAS